jgi:MFS family permease
MFSKSFRQEFRLLKVFYIWGFIGGMAALLAPYYAIYFLDIGLSFSQIGLIFSASALAAILFEVPTGAIADRFGRKFSVVLSWLLAAITVILIPFTNSFALILLLFFLMSVFSTLGSGSDQAWLTDYLKQRRKEDLVHTAIARQESFMYAGSIFAFIASGIVVAKLSMSWLWYITGALTFATALFLIWFGKEKFTPKKSNGVKSDLKDTFSDSKKAAIYASKNKVLLIMILGSFFAAMASMSNVIWSPYMQQLGIELYFIGPLFAILSVCGMVFSNFSVKYLKFFGSYKTSFIATASLSIILLLSLAFVNSAWLFVILWLAFSSISFLACPVSWSYFQKNTPSRMRATMGSLRNMVSQIGVLIAPAIGGYVADMLGIRAAILFAALCIVPNIFLYLRLDDAKPKYKEI